MTCSHRNQEGKHTATSDGFCASCLLEQGLRIDTPAGADSFGCYEPLCEIGEGGMGIAYLAEQTRPIRRDVALKVLKPGGSDTGAMARFETERQALALMDHPSIARVLDAGISRNGRPYLVMEFVDGSPITEYCDRRALQISDRLALFLDVCRAVDHANRKGIIHRDIKPSNVLITEIDGSPVPKVIDFGIAKAVGHLTGQTLQTMAGEFVGTLEYMSPEQLSSAPSRPEAPADVYSLGVLLYELLCGVLPFDADRLRAAGIVNAALIVRDEEPPSPAMRLSALGDAAIEIGQRRGLSKEALVRELSGDLGCVVRKAMEKDSRLRYPSAGHLAADIERYLQGEPVLAGPLSRLYRAKRFVRRFRFAILAAASIASLTAVILLLPKQPARAPLQIAPLTTYSGDETSPTFSPDGSEVAFVWNRESGDSDDIYALRIGDAEPRRLTTYAGADSSPAWSPDGRWIAFLRARSGQTREIMLVSPSDGTERPVPAGQIDVDSSMDWSPDSRFLLISTNEEPAGKNRIAAISVETGVRHWLSAPGPGEDDQSPSISPDGKLLAFNRDAGQGTSSIVTLPLDKKLQPAGPERQLAIPELGPARLRHPRWVSSRELVIGVWSGRQNRRLWRVPLTGGKPEMLGELGEQINVHAISRGGDKLAFSRSSFDTDVRAIQLNASRKKASVDRPAMASSRYDQNPAISPDGLKVAFEATRTGFSEIWLAASDGSRSTPLTRLETFAGSPRWSPDNQRIAFDGRYDNQSEIYTVSVSDGQPERLTNHPAADILPAWSADGRSIYFASNRSGTHEIWRIPVSGGDAIQITRGGGYEAVASPGGRWIYYTKNASRTTSIWRVPVDGGEETLIVDGVRSRCFDVTPRGLYFGVARSDQQGTELRFLDFATSKTSGVASFDRLLRHRISLSPDEHLLLYTDITQQGNDLTIAENFR